MKRISSLAILVVILVLLNGLAFADFNSTSANITHQYFPVKKWGWFKYVGYGNMAGETETFEVLGTEFVNSVNCLKFEIKVVGDVATAWIAQDTDGNVWFLKIIISEGVFTLVSGISNPLFYAEPKVGDILSQIFPESAGTYSEVTEIGIDVNLSTSLGSYENCIEITSYFDYEVEDLSYYCSGIGLVKTIYLQEGPPETGQELSEFGFVDVPPGSNHEASIYAIYNAGITTGCAQNPLRGCPQDPVTRAQMAAFIIRALEGEPTTDCDPNNPPFTDVDPNLPVCKYIKRLSELDITTGYPDGTYRPYNTVTRAQMAAFIIRALEGEPPTDYCASGSPFPDVSANSPTCKYIKRFFEMGITAGYSDGTYRPSNNVIRRQMAAFLDRAFLDTD